MEDYRVLIDNEIKEIIEKNIFGYEFKFTEGQYEVIMDICNHFLNWANKKSTIDCIILSAPTGYGKSIIAMFASKILQRLSFKGYILTVDLTLQQQYEADIKRFALSYHSIKGTDNYKCFVNSEPFSRGDCHSLNLTYKELSELQCFSKCAYLQARQRAMKASVSIVNYAYWLIQRNKNGDTQDSPFKIRDFVFFDECHKIDDIIQNHFSIKLKDDFSFILQNLHTSLFEKSIQIDSLERKEVGELIEILFSSDDKEEIRDVLDKLGTDLKKYVDADETIAAKIKEETAPGERMDSDWLKITFLMKEIRDLQNKIFDYLDIVEEIGLKNIIKRVTEINEVRYVEFLSLKEDFLIQRYLLPQAGFKIFMSATIGNIAQFANIIGLDRTKTRAIKLNSVFNYDQSPIYFSKKYKLDYKNKKENIPNVIKQVDDIIAKNFDSNGIIHSGSYEFSQAIMRNSKFKNKIIDYTSDNKRKQVKKFLSASGKILLGPSILEGLDLYDDKCRYQIFFKVPFPSLGDPLVAAKLNESQEWYVWKTALSIIQGSNRGIRNINDYAVTYILDATIVNLIKQKAFDIDFMKRLKVYDE